MTSPQNTTLCPSIHRSCPDTCLVWLQVKAGVAPLGPSCTHPQLGVRRLEPRDTGPAAISPCAPVPRATKSPLTSSLLRGSGAAPHMLPLGRQRGSLSMALRRVLTPQAGLATEQPCLTSLCWLCSARTALQSCSAGRAGRPGVLRDCSQTALARGRSRWPPQGHALLVQPRRHSAGLGSPQAQAVCCSLI